MKLLPCLARPQTETTPTGPLTSCSAATASGSIRNLPRSSQYTSRSGRPGPPPPSPPFLTGASPPASPALGLPRRPSICSIAPPARRRQGHAAAARLAPLVSKWEEGRNRNRSGRGLRDASVGLGWVRVESVPPPAALEATRRFHDSDAFSPLELDVRLGRCIFGLWSTVGRCSARHKKKGLFLRGPQWIAHLFVLGQFGLHGWAYWGLKYWALHLISWPVLLIMSWSLPFEKEGNMVVCNLYVTLLFCFSFGSGKNWNCQKKMSADLLGICLVCYQSYIVY